LDQAFTWSGAVLSGSTALGLFAVGIANAPAGLAAFNAGFEHRTGYEWLLRDAAEVDAYVADPWCGWGVPEDAIPSLFAPAPRLADPALLARIRSDLPILIASGDVDPLAAGGALIQQLGQRYRDAGVADVTVKLYPGARHEILNETNRDEVTGDIVAWLRARVEVAFRLMSALACMLSRCWSDGSRLVDPEPYFRFESTLPFTTQQEGFLGRF
jgi:hypothetical protein